MDFSFMKRAGTNYAHKTTFVMILLFWGLQMSSQNILIEEFTNLSAPEYKQTHQFVDSVSDKMIKKRFLTIKYHTDFPVPDTFSTPVSRLAYIENIPEVPATLVDGKVIPAGPLRRGHTLNLTSPYLDSVLNSKTIKVNFFGLELFFSEDFKEITGTSGVSSTFGLIGQTVYMTRALVEEVVDMDQPVGPDSLQHFTNIFRGFITFRTQITIPPNGSHHSGSIVKLPQNIKSLSKLKMIVFLEDINGKVIDCAVINAPFVDEYKMDVTNNTLKQIDYCQNKVVPTLTVKNKCPNVITGLKTNIISNQTIFPKIITDSIFPGQEKTFKFDTLILDGGRHYINVVVEKILDDTLTAKIIKTNGPIRYLVSGDHMIPNEGFEDTEPGSTGNFMVRSQNDFTFVKVNATDLGHDKPIGGYGNSDHSLMVDLYDWEYDEDDAGIAYLADNKNFAFLHYNHFDLKDVKYPALYFDVATPLGKNYRGIEVGASVNPCGNGYTKLVTFTPAELTKIPEQRNTRYIPKKEDWITKKVSLDAYENTENLQIRLFTNCPPFKKNANVLYLDNIRVVSDTFVCSTGDIVLTSQNDVNNFVRDFKNCNILQGNFCIGRCDDTTKTSNITDLSGLNFIREIQGSLSIKNNVVLTSLKGLEFVMKVTGDVEISHNNKLTNILAFKPNQPIGKNIIVTHNPVLEEIAFHTSNIEINGDFIVKNNPSIKIFGGFQNLEKVKGDLIFHDIVGNVFSGGAAKIHTVEGSVSVQHNPNMTFLYILRLLEHVGGDFIFRNNPKMGGIYINAVKFIGGDLVLEDCENDVYFPLPDSLGGSLILRNNKKLSDIMMYDKLAYSYLFSNPKDSFALVLTGNPKLSECTTQLLCELIRDTSKPVNIYNNGPKCTSPEDIETGCFPSSNEAVFYRRTFLYPNPVSDKLFISDYPDNVSEIRIINSLGETVWFTSNKKIKEIDVQFIPSGVYTLFISGKFHRFTKI
jgi:hypothetical protein